MSTSPRQQDESWELLPGLAPAFRFYLFVGLISLLVVWLALTQKSLLLIATIAVLVGVAGMAPYLLPQRWKHLARPRWAIWMPFLMLILLFLIEMLFGYGYWPHTYNFDLTDLMLATGLLTYLAAQFRLFSLAGNLTPVDRRPPPDTPPAAHPPP